MTRKTARPAKVFPLKVSIEEKKPDRETVNIKKSQNCGPFPYGGGAQPHSIAFGGVFPNITEAILVDEISTKVRIYPPKVIT